MKDLKTIVDEVLAGASDAEIVIDSYDGQTYMPWIFNTEFYTKVNGQFLRKPQKENVIVLNIPNFTLFLNNLEEYLEIARKYYGESKKYFAVDSINFDKKLIHDLLVNASSFEIDNITKYVVTRTNMLKSSNIEKEICLGDMTFEDKNKTITCNVFEKITKLHPNFESPLKFEVKFCDKNSKEEFFLPAVLFGVNGKKEALVSAVQNFHKEQVGEGKNELTKFLDRYFRKVNKNIEKDSVEANVSPNSVVAMTFFFEYLKSLGVKNVQANDFLPLRYYSTLNSKLNNALYLGKNTDDVVENLDKNQFNMTNKFMYLFLRMSEHFDDLEVEYDAIRQCMNVKFLERHFTKKGNIIENIADYLGENAYNFQKENWFSA